MRPRGGPAGDRSAGPRRLADRARRYARRVAAFAWACAVALALVHAVPGAARAAELELASFEVSRDDDGVHIAYALAFDLSKSVDDALTKGVPLFFVAEAEVFRDRWYWRDRRVARTERVWRVAYQPLTSTYRVTYGGLSQNHATRADALAAISRAARWKVADAAQIEDGSRHYVEFSYRLETSLLPRPMQIGIAGQSDWSLSIRRTQRFN